MQKSASEIPFARPTLTVVVCAYTLDRWSDIVDAVASLRAQDPAPDEILLVVDHNPKLLELCRRELAGAGLRVLSNRQQRGLSGGRNTGVAAAKGDVVAFLDDDACADPGWAAHLLDGYRSPEVLGVGGRVEPAWATARPSWFPPEFDWVVGCTYRGMPEEAAPVRNFIGANMSFRRDVLEGAGGFSTALGRVGTTPLGCEETELCIRAAAQHPGSVLWYEPAASVRHHVPQQRTTRRYFRSRCWSEGLSKAAVTGMRGSGAALASERSYLRSTIPRALRQAVDRQTAAPGVVPALATGVGITAAGYATGRLRARTPGSLQRSLTVLPLLVALGLWALALPRIDVRHPGGLGLIGQLPSAYYAALVLLALGFAGSLRRGTGGSRWPAAYTVALLAVLKATPALRYDTVRYAWAWKHDAIIAHLLANGRLRTGATPPGSVPLGDMTPYEQWPGFFTLNGMLVRAFGVPASLAYANWAPFVFGLLMLLPLLLIYRTFSSDRRLVWVAVWIFVLGNWVGQDYLAPQAFAFLLHLTVLAVVLRHFVRPAEQWPTSIGSGGRGPAGLRTGGLRWAGLRWGRFGSGGLKATTVVSPDRDRAAADPIPGTDRRQRALWVLLLIPVLAAVDSSHQLTPLMLVSSLVAICLTRRHRNFGLLLTAVAVMLAWDLTVAGPFFRQQLDVLTHTFGELFTNSRAGYANAPTGEGAQLVGLIDKGLAATILLLAVAGALLRRRLTRGALPLLLLAAAPVPLLAVNDYGGEMIFRVLLFALPGAAFFAAAALVPAGSPVDETPWWLRARRWRNYLSAAALPVALLALLAGFLPSYFGKEQLYYFPPGEVELAQQLYAHAPSGSLIMAATDNWPEAYHDYDHYQHWWFAQGTQQDNAPLLGNPLQFLAGNLPADRPVLVELSHSQQILLEGSGNLPPGGYARIEQALTGSDRFRTVFRSSSGVVLQYRPPGSTG